MVKMVIVCRTDLNMRKGKIAAQVGHAVESFLIKKVASGSPRKDVLIQLSEDQLTWIATGRTKIVVAVENEQELTDLIKKAEAAGITVNSITDIGKTEFHGQHTLTCASFGPNKIEELNPITGHLKLL